MSAQRVWMVPAETRIGGRRLRYAVSDNDGGGDQIWAVNLHGFFAGGGMYWRESARLAASRGWRVVNPSLPAFGGSDPLPWEELSYEGYAETVRGLLDQLGAERVVVLGHSMGGAMAMTFAEAHPDRTLGVVFRDGIGVSSWLERRGIGTLALGPLVPDAGALADLAIGAVLDVPDMLWGRAMAMTRGLLPDALRNVGAFGSTLPVAAMLFAVDLTERYAALADSHDIPILCVWGRGDRIVPRHAGEQFVELVGGSVEYVRGTHSWMLPRPMTQSLVLSERPSGQRFVEAVDRRHRELPTPVSIAR